MPKKASTKPESPSLEVSESASLLTNEQDISRRVRAGLSRKQAEEAHARQKAHDAALAAAATAN
jgi:hypothetical protein